MGGVRRKATESVFWKISLEEMIFKLISEVWEEQDEFSRKKGVL